MEKVTKSKIKNTKTTAKITARITEKASALQSGNVYIFDVMPGTNKNDIKKEILALYKVKPIRVNVLAIPKKRAMLRGKIGSKAGGRKAHVYLKEGDKIELV